MPKISIITPSYNHAQYIKAAIDSVLSQTFQDFEMIIVDDGSKDESVDLIKSYKDKRIKLYTFEENRGAVVATNYCISKASGEYITLLNSDDMFLPEKLEKQFNYLENHKEIAAVFGFAQAIDDSGNEIIPNPPYFEPRDMNCTRQDFLKKLYYEGNQLIHPSVMIRKEIFQDIGLYDSRLCQIPDYLEWVKLCFKHDVYILPDKLIKFRTRANNMNTSSSKRKGVLDRIYFEYQYLLEEYYNNINDYDLLEKIFPHINDLSFYIKDNKLIKFYLALAIFYSKVYTDDFGSVRKVFALQKLFLEFSNNEKAEYIKTHCGFYYPELIEIAGQEHIFFSDEDSIKIQAYEGLQKTIKWKILKQISETFVYKIFKKIYRNTKYYIYKVSLIFKGEKKSVEKKDFINLKIPNPKELISYYAKDLQHFEENLKGKNIYNSKNILDFVKKAKGKYLFLNNKVFNINFKLFDKAQFLLENNNLDCIIFTDLTEDCYNDKFFLQNLIPKFQNNSKYALFLKNDSFRNNIQELCDSNSQIVFLIQLLGFIIKNKLRVKIFRIFDFKEVKINIKEFTELKIGRYNLSKEELLDFQTINSTEYDVKNSLINFQKPPKHQGKNILFALPFLLDAGDNHHIRKFVNSLKNKINNLSIITTLDVKASNYLGFGDGEPRYSLITKDIVHLYKQCPDWSHWGKYIFYLIQTRGIEFIYIIGCEYIYRLLPIIKQKFPNIKIIDEQFNSIGHFNNNRKYSSCIDLTVVENTNMSNLLINKFNEIPSHVKIIPSGIDTKDTFNNSNIKDINQLYKKFQINNNTFNILFLGRLSEEKGPDIFLRIAKRFISVENVNFIMAGDGPMRSKIVETIKKEKLTNKVRLVGMVNSHEILAVSNLLILPSRFDGRPAAVMESLSMQVPVIASRTGGLPDMVKDGYDGYLVDVNDIDAFEKSITELIANKDKFQTFKSNAREFAIKNFDEADMVRAYNKLLD